MSLDGSFLDAADTQENEKAFDRPGASRGETAVPKMRFVALLENGTHVLRAPRMGPFATDERTLARDVVAELRGLSSGGWPAMPLFAPGKGRLYMKRSSTSESSPAGIGSTPAA